MALDLGPRDTRWGLRGQARSAVNKEMTVDDIDWLARLRATAPEPDAEAAEPRIMVCPTDLWRLSRGDITELCARVSGDPWLLANMPAIDGLVMLPAYGPTNEEHARPPPCVKLSQAFAVAAVENLETASTETERKTERYLTANPTKALDLQGMNLPF